MKKEQGSPVELGGVIGITDDGYPILTGERACRYWQAGAQELCVMRKCWYYRFSDFRKTSRMTLEKSICRNPRCRIVSDGGKNEEVECGG